MLLPAQPRVLIRVWIIITCACAQPAGTPPPALWWVANVKASAAAATWAGLESSGGRKKISPSPLLPSNQVMFS